MQPINCLYRRWNRLVDQMQQELFWSLVDHGVVKLIRRTSGSNYLGEWCLRKCPLWQVKVTVEKVSKLTGLKTWRFLIIGLWNPSVRILVSFHFFHFLLSLFCSFFIFLSLSFFFSFIFSLLDSFYLTFFLSLFHYLLLSFYGFSLFLSLFDPSYSFFFSSIVR
jgi:hypothetical protein